MIECAHGEDAERDIGVSQDAGDATDGAVAAAGDDGVGVFGKCLFCGGDEVVTFKGADFDGHPFGGEGFADVFGLIDIWAGSEAAGLGVDESDDFHVRLCLKTNGLTTAQNRSRC